MSEKHQIALVSTSSCDSGVSGLSQSMANGNANGNANEVAITVTPTRKRNVSLERKEDCNGDDASRMDCCDTTASSVSMSTSISMSDHELESESTSEEGKEVVHDADATISSQTTGRCQRRLFQKQSDCNSNCNSSKDSSKNSSKPKQKHKKSLNFLRPQFKLASKTDDVPSITDSSTSTKEDEDDEEKPESNATQETERLFQDQMDIVAFQEWPPQRRQPIQRYSRYRYRNHHSHNFHQYPLHSNNNNNNVSSSLSSSSPSVTSFSVETIATKLGRSPVVVSFDDVDHIYPPAPIPLAPIELAGRIPTGRFQPSFSFSEEDSSYRSTTNRPASCSDLMADSIFKTIRSMMCTNNNNNNKPV